MTRDGRARSRRSARQPTTRLSPRSERRSVRQRGRQPGRLCCARTGDLGARRPWPVPLAVGSFLHQVS